ncbi:MAG: hypothetical protein ACYDD4_05790 [Acidimicrobiales bacterium]
MSQRRAGAAPTRGAPSKRQRSSAPDVDTQALALREGGSSFSAIARKLELGRAMDAHRSFLRALRSHDGPQRKQLVDNEEARLDRLEQRIRNRDAAEPSKIERRLLGVEKLRESIRQ